MATTFITTPTYGAGVLHAFSDEGDSLVILQGGSLLATAGSPFSGTDFDDLDLFIQGAVYSSAYHTWNGANLHFAVAAGGSVVSTVVGASNSFLFFQASGSEIINDGLILAGRSLAIVTAGGSAVSNFGTIRGKTAVYLGANEASPDVLVNGGLIHANGIGNPATFNAHNHAIKIGSDGCVITNLAAGRIVADGPSGAGIVLLATAGGVSIRNAGLIESVSNFAINLALVALDEAASTLINRGEITGGLGAFNGSLNADLVVNRGLLAASVVMNSGDDTLDNRRGLIEGTVDLGAGNDLLDNRDGQIEGRITGGLGNDRLIASARVADIFDGGAGTDILDYRFGPAVIVALDGSFDNAGGALGDEITGVETIYGARHGADHLRGGAGANQLRGEGGADTLDGAAGADVLIGGRGADSLIGGLGNDSFVYQSLDQIGDVIADFSAVAGNDDRFQFTASGFGGGLVAGVLAAAQFQSRADNLAQDGNDRFIFNTLDQTLWFDVDGTGSKAPVMIADLQAGAIVTAADIFVV